MYKGLVATDPNFVAFPSLPFNLRAVIFDTNVCWGKTQKERDNHRKKCKNLILTKFAEIQHKREHNNKCILKYWIRTANINYNMMEISVLNIIIKYQRVMSFDDKVLKISISRYMLSIPAQS